MRKGGVPVPKNMYAAAGDGPCNEELALRIQVGDKNAARYSSFLSIPISRYNQLRRVAYLCAEAQDTSESELTKAVCEKLKVSSKAAENC